MSPDKLHFQRIYIGKYAHAKQHFLMYTVFREYSDFRRQMFSQDNREL